jgi:hypothetical protein
VHAFGVDSLPVRHLEQRQQNISTNLRGTGLSRYTEAISPTRDFDVKAIFDLPQVLIELTAKISQAAVVGGLEDDVPRKLDSIQST